jgi:hypothetical protein
VRSTPATLRILLIALTAACLAWGAVAALMLDQHRQGSASATGTSEPLSLAAEQMYQSLADADVTSTTGFLYGSQQPAASQQRYRADVAQASAALKQLTAAGADTSALTSGLPLYTGYVQNAITYNAAGLPAGASYMQTASEQMHLVLLPAARGIYQQENAQLQSDGSQATGLPFAVIAAVAGLVLLIAIIVAQRWLTRRTNRVLNRGLGLATLAGLLALGWLVIATAAGRGDMLTAASQGSRPAQNLAQASLASLQARGDETLNLISRTGSSGFQADFTSIAASLDAKLTGSAKHDADAWFAVNGRMQALDQTAAYTAETQLATGSSNADFGTLQTDLAGAIKQDQAAFGQHAPAARDVFTYAEISVAVLAIMMAASAAWGLTRRLTEYR